MVQSNVLVFGWNLAVPGREGLAGELFAHTMGFFEKQKSTGKLESFQPVFLASHGGDLNGFFLITGTHAQLDTLETSDEFVDIVMRAGQALTNVGVIHGFAGNVVPELMNRWTKSIPAR